MYSEKVAVNGVGSKITFFTVLFMGLMLAFSQGCVCKKTYKAMVDERDDCVGEKKLLMVEADALEAENELLSTKLVIRKTGSAVMNSLYQELVAELETEIAGNQITVKQMQSGVTVHLSSDVLFTSGSAKLSESGRKVLLHVAAELAQVPYQIIVGGFSDNVPVGGKLAEIYPSNWDLAGGRATSVVRVLEESGIGKERLRALSMGENMPVASNDTPEGRAKNRRIEIRLRPVIVAE
ncbi:MAG: OmpA family protein [Deltaproteobacteria bacterium]|nr:OmpA family protein [Deltaproteobacteria bacterium]